MIRDELKKKLLQKQIFRHVNVQNLKKKPVLIVKYI